MKDYRNIDLNPYEILMLENLLENLLKNGTINTTTGIENTNEILRKLENQFNDSKNKF